ncbi:Integral membrane protein OS=Streptomyces tendae OX=1932 GN=GUR47_13720 PE=4 SV=1 [Streptomyces tendae]
MPEQDVTVGQLLLAEYESVKSEQRARIGFRDNLLYVTLAVVAAVIAATAQAEQPSMLLALPPVCLVLGWTYLVNDEKISAIGLYVRDDLGPKLAELAAHSSGFATFGWEAYHRSDTRRRSRKTIQTVIAPDGVLTRYPPGGADRFLGERGAAPLLVALSVAGGVRRRPARTRPVPSHR